MNPKRAALSIVSLAVSAGLVAWLVSRIDPARAAELLRQADWRWLVLALLLTCALPFSSVVRWRGVLRAQSALLLPFGVSLRAVLLANVLNSFLPSKAGDVAKAVYLRRRGGLSRGAGTVVLERLVDLGVLGLLAVLGFALSGARWGLVTGAGLLGGVGAAFAAIALLPLGRLPLPGPVRDLAEQVRTVFADWSRRPRAIAQTVAGSLATWSLGGLTVFALARAIGADVGPGFAYAVFPAAILAGLVPVTVSGIGTRDAAFVALLSGRATLEEATLIGLGYTLFAYWLLSLLSLPAVAWELVTLLRRRDDPGAAPTARRGES